MSTIDRRLAAAFACLVAVFPLCAHAQRPVDVAPNAPRDKPTIIELCRFKMQMEASAPIVQRARSELSGVVARFHAGLPSGETFFVTALLRDSVGHREQLFVAVDSVVDDRFVGRIWSQVIMLVGYHLRQPIEVPRSEIVDWMISKLDGTEEGNALGKFLETYTPPATCPDTAAATRASRIR